MHRQSLPTGIVGRNSAAWSSLGETIKRMVQNVSNEEARAASLIEQFRDRQEGREEAQRKQLLKSQNSISVMLSVFSPLSFMAGVYGTYTARCPAAGLPDPLGPPPFMTWSWPAPPLPSRTMHPIDVFYFPFQGMNFKYIPELDWPHGYHFFWGMSLLTTVSILAYQVCRALLTDSFLFTGLNLTAGVGAIRCIWV
jgi:hypothetical protein